VKIVDARYRVIDTETTDKEPTVAKLIEVAWREVDYQGAVYERFQELCDPGVPIPPTASAVHHIVDADVRGAFPAENLIEFVKEKARLVDCWVAHNAPYDSTVLQVADRPWLCTHRLAKHLWPEIENHSNQVIRYTLKLKPDISADAPAHRAANDVAVTAEILRTALPLVFKKWPGIETIEQLIAKVNAPCVLHRIPFAGHGYPLFTEAEDGLLRWIINKQAGGEDCIYTAEHELERREEAAAAGQGFGLMPWEEDEEEERTQTKRDDRTADMFDGERG